MREMIFNHASVGAFDSDRRKASACLYDVVGGMRQLIDRGVVNKTLRTARYWHDTRCQLGYSLHDVLCELRRDERGYFLGLATKSPLLAGVDQDIKGRVVLCEEQTLSAEEGQPLVLAAIADGVLVGFPSKPRWDRDQTAVEFDELLPNETFCRSSEKVDQLTRFAHADPICARHQSRMAGGIGNNPERLWEKRQDIFPHLLFGLDVEQHLVNVANHLPVIIKKLSFLDQSGKEWAETGGTVPPWKTQVTPESDGVMSDQKLRNKRKFRSRSGSQELFEWHARFGRGGRIHLRFDAGSRTIEVGYIGPHLPL